MSQPPSILVQPIGYVCSPVRDPEAMPTDGVPARVEVLPEFVGGLPDIESNSHLIVLGWFHRSDRSRLTVRGRGRQPGAPERGVFGLRSSVRPNPIGLDVARLVRRQGAVLFFDRLDMLDGTPVVDLKRYSPGWDDVFAARTSRQRRPLPPADADVLRSLLIEVENFCGQSTAGARRVARLIADLCTEWQISPTDPDLVVTVPFRAGKALDGGTADALQALTRATFGSGRLRICGGQKIVLCWRDQTVEAVATPTEPPDDLTELAAAPLASLWTIIAR